MAQTLGTLRKQSGAGAAIGVAAIVALKAFFQMKRTPPLRATECC